MNARIYPNAKPMRPDNGNQVDDKKKLEFMKKAGCDREYFLQHWIEMHHIKREWASLLLLVIIIIQYFVHTHSSSLRENREISFSHTHSHRAHHRCLVGTCWIKEMSKINIPSGETTVFEVAFRICFPATIHFISAGGFDGAVAHCSGTTSPTRASVAPVIVTWVGATAMREKKNERMEREKKRLVN